MQSVVVRKAEGLGGGALYLEGYTDRIREAVVGAEVSDGFGEVLSLEEGFNRSVGLLGEADKTIFFVGNGGSAAIAAHMATDFMKNGGLGALFLGDAALTTCLSNDLGYHEVFATPIRKLMRNGDVLVAISSSGASANILTAVNAALGVGGRVLTLSGFEEGNPLRELGGLNWYVKSGSYGVVENAHQVLLHSFLDKLMEG